MKAKINNQLVDVKVLKTRKLFWIFEQVLVSYYGELPIPLRLIFTVESVWGYQEKWIPKSNLIEDYE